MRNKSSSNSIIDEKSRTITFTWKAIALGAGSGGRNCRKGWLRSSMLLEEWNRSVRKFGDGNGAVWRNFTATYAHGVVFQRGIVMARGSLR